MTDDTSQPPAPQPGWVATVTLEWVEQGSGLYTRLRWPNGTVEPFFTDNVASLDWSPPQPPPWEPKIGQPACIGFEPVIVRGLHNGLAWVEDLDGDMDEEGIANLSPPKEGA